MKKQIRKEIFKIAIKSANTSVFSLKQICTEPTENEVKAICFLNICLTAKLLMWPNKQERGKQLLLSAQGNCQGTVFSVPNMRNF